MAKTRHGNDHASTACSCNMDGSAADAPAVGSSMATEIGGLVAGALVAGGSAALVADAAAGGSRRKRLLMRSTCGAGQVGRGPEPC